MEVTTGNSDASTSLQVLAKLWALSTIKVLTLFLVFVISFIF
jgi:hypothetical protein